MLLVVLLLCWLLVLLEQVLPVLSLGLDFAVTVPPFCGSVVVPPRLGTSVVPPLNLRQFHAVT